MRRPGPAGAPVARRRHSMHNSRDVAGLLRPASSAAQRRAAAEAAPKESPPPTTAAMDLAEAKPAVLRASMDFDDFTHRDWTASSVSAKRRNSAMMRRRRTIAATATANNPLAELVTHKPPVVPPKMATLLSEWDEDKRAHAMAVLENLSQIWLNHSIRPAWSRWFDQLQAERNKFARMRKEDLKGLATETVYSTSPGLRSSEQLGPLLHWITSLRVLPDKIDRPHLLDLCQHVEHRHLAANQILFLQGEPGDAFYIVFNGCVGLFAINDVHVANRRLRSWRMYPAREQEAVTQNPLHLGEHVFSVVAGKSFGEVSLFTGEGTRTTSAVATEATDMLVVPREVYQRCLRQYHVPAFELNAKLRYLKGLNFFSEWTDQHLMRLAYAMKRKTFPRHSVIVHQGTVHSHVYFTISGECKVTVRAEMNPNNDKKVAVAELEALHLVAPRKAHPVMRIVEVAIMGANQIVGEMSLLSGKTTATASVIANSEVEVYLLPVSAFLKFVIKGSSGTNTMQKLQENVRERRVLRQQRVDREQLMAKRQSSGDAADAGRPKSSSGYKPLTMQQGMRGTPNYFSRPQTAPQRGPGSPSAAPPSGPPADRSPARGWTPTAVRPSTAAAAGGGGGGGGGGGIMRGWSPTARPSTAGRMGTGPAASAAVGRVGGQPPPEPVAEPEPDPPMEITRERRFSGDVHSVRRLPQPEHLSYPLNPYTYLMRARSTAPTVSVTEEEVLTKVLLGQDRPKSACTMTAIERRRKANRNRPKSAAFLTPADEARIDAMQRQEPHKHSPKRNSNAPASLGLRRGGFGRSEEDDDEEEEEVGREPPPTKLRIKRFSARPKMVKPMVCTPGLLAVEEREAATAAAEELLLCAQPTLEEALMEEARAARAAQLELEEPSPGSPTPSKSKRGSRGSRGSASGKGGDVMHFTLHKTSGTPPLLPGTGTPTRRSSSALGALSTAGSRRPSSRMSPAGSRRASEPASRRGSGADGAVGPQELLKRLESQTGATGDARVEGEQEEEEEEEYGRCVGGDGLVDEHDSIASLFQTTQRDVVEDQNDVLARHYKQVEKLLHRSERLLQKVPEKTELDRIKTVVKATVLTKKAVHLGEAARARGRIQHRVSNRK